MSDSGLSTRLRQQSRRAGLMVGITMVLAMVILIFGAAGVFAWLARPFSDLIPMAAPAFNAPAAEAPVDTGDTGDAPIATTEPEVAIQVEPAEGAPAEPTIASSPDDFEPTHQIAPGSSINFRTGPSTADTIIEAFTPATPLEYLDEDATSDGGERWMRFRSENGDEGWVREIDTVTFQP